MKRFQKPRKKQSPPVTIRSDYFNTQRGERYYAMDNTPTFNQFKGYHFIDNEGRMYKIAVDDGKIFENERFAHPNPRPSYQTTSLQPRKQKKCVTNADGFVKLFVKLPNQSVKWFSSQSIDRSLVLTVQRKKNGREGSLTVKLRAAYKFNEKRRTGTIYISHVNKNYINDLLNE